MPTNHVPTVVSRENRHVRPVVSVRTSKRCRKGTTLRTHRTGVK